MERLDMRRETPDIVKKLFKLTLYGVLAFFTVLGLWFTISYSVPAESAVDMQLENGQRISQDGAVQAMEIRLTGTYQRYRLGNENDQFFGTLTFAGREVKVEVSFVPGAKCGMAHTPLGPMLLSRDLKGLLLEFEEGEALCLLQAGDNVADLVAAIADNAEWSKKFRWSWE